MLSHIVNARGYLKRREEVDRSDLTEPGGSTERRFQYFCNDESCTSGNDGACRGHLIDDVAKKTIYMYVYLRMRTKCVVRLANRNTLSLGLIWRYQLISISPITTSKSTSSCQRFCLAATGALCTLSSMLRRRYPGAVTLTVSPSDYRHHMTPSSRPFM
jgi:hypothetical protein